MLLGLRCCKYNIVQLQFCTVWPKGFRVVLKILTVISPLKADHHRLLSCQHLLWRRGRQSNPGQLRRPGWNRTLVDSIGASPRFRAHWLLKWTHPNQTAQGENHIYKFIRDFFVPSGCKISEQVCLATSSRPKQQNVRFRVVLHLDQHYSHATAQFQQIWKFYFQFNIDGKPNVWTSPPKKRYNVVACTTTSTIHYLLYSIIHSHEISWNIWTLYPCLWFISKHSLIWGHFRSEVVESSWFIWKSATPKIQCFKSSCSPLNIQKYHKIPLMGCPNQLNPWKSHIFRCPSSPKTIQKPIRIQPRGPLWLQHLHLRTREERLDTTLQRRNVGVVFEVPRPGLIVVLPRCRWRELGWSIGSAPEKTNAQKGAGKKEMTLEECLVLIQAIQNGE